jgi:hypothetical protein
MTYRSRLVSRRKFEGRALKESGSFKKVQDLRESDAGPWRAHLHISPKVSVQSVNNSTSSV